MLLHDECSSSDWSTHTVTQSAPHTSTSTGPTHTRSGTGTQCCHEYINTQICWSMDFLKCRNLSINACYCTVLANLIMIIDMMVSSSLFPIHIFMSPLVYDWTGRSGTSPSTLHYPSACVCLTTTTTTICNWPSGPDILIININLSTLVPQPAPVPKCCKL